MKLFARSFTDARHADEAYRALSNRVKDKRLRAARKAAKRPDATCPHCRYDLRGMFSRGDPPRPCPECGKLVSPGAAIMIWYRKRIARRHGILLLLLSGPAQALLAWVYIILGAKLEAPPTVAESLMLFWILGAVANAALLPYSALRMQLAAAPERSEVFAALLALLYTIGSVLSFFVSFLLIFAVIASYG